MEKRWSKMVKKAENESSQFALGFALGRIFNGRGEGISIHRLFSGLLANETILMPPQLVLAAPLTPLFKKLVSNVPTLDNWFHSGTFLIFYLIT